MSPLSPYLNVDPRYLVQDTDEFILPTGANETRGRFELAFFTIGGSCMTALLYSAFGVAIEKARGAEDDINTVAAGTLTGMVFKSAGAWIEGRGRGGLVGLALSGAYALYNNWDHITGSP
ncbi:unnamed protein product, partial [Tetraodon nigroviridis]